MRGRTQQRTWGILLAALALAAAPGGAAEPDAVSRGIELLEQGRLGAAEATLREAVARDPGSAGAHFALARLAVAAGRPDEALRELERSRELGLESPALLTELGAAYQEAGRLSESLEALELAAELRPEDARVRLLLGLSRLGLGDDAGAAAEFEAVGDDPPGFRQLALYNLGVIRLKAGDSAAARGWLAAAAALDAESVTGRRAAGLFAEGSSGREAASSRPWSLSGRAGLFYDDNVTSRGADLSTGVGDAGMAFELAGRYRLLNRPGLRLDAGYDFYQTVHFDFGEFDQQLHGIDLDASRQFGEIEAGVAYRYTLSLLGNDFLLGLHEVQPRVGYSPRPGWYAVVWPRFRAKQHTETGRDSIQWALGADHFFFIGSGGDYALFGSQMELEDAGASEFDYLGAAVRTGYRKPFRVLGGEFLAGVDYRFRWRGYRSMTPSIGERRLDLVHAARLRLARRIGESIEVSLDYDLVASDSNLPSVDYLQNVVTVGIGFAF